MENKALLLVAGNRRKRIGLATVILLLAMAALSSRWFIGASTNSVRTAEVVRGEFVDRLSVRGEIKAAQSVLMTAPQIYGDLMIRTLSPEGSRVKKGDVVAELDATSLQRDLEQRKSDLREAEAEIAESQAKTRSTEEQDRTDVLKAQYDVERARLDVSKESIVPRLDAEKARLALSDAEQKLKDAENKLKGDHAAGVADLASHQQKREKAKIQIQQIQRNLASMTLRAAVDGIVTILSNQRAGGIGGGNAPPFRPGDRVWAGAAIAELPDLSRIQLRSAIEESERSRVKTGQSAVVHLDSIPEMDFRAHVISVSPLTKPDYSTWPPARNFELILQLDQGDPRIRPGMNATARIAVGRLANVLLLPSEAVFHKAGQSIAYVQRRRSFEERAIREFRSGEGRTVVSEGLRQGERVALQNPYPDEGRP